MYILHSQQGKIPVVAPYNTPCCKQRYNELEGVF